MAFEKLDFTKDWSVTDKANSKYFPTVEEDETKVRNDAQLLYNEIKSAFNKLVDLINSAEGAANIGYSETTDTNGDVVIQTIADAIKNIQAGQLAPGQISTVAIDDEAVTKEKLSKELQEYMSPEYHVSDMARETLGIEKKDVMALAVDAVLRLVQNQRPVVGTYEGNGEASQIINLGFKPSWGIIFKSSGSEIAYYENASGTIKEEMKQAVFTDGKALSFRNYPVVETVETGIKVYSSTSSRHDVFANDGTCVYVVYR